MTANDAKLVLHCPSKIIVLTALSYVNLTDREQDVLILRHMRGHTQEQTAEELECSTNTVQNTEKSALEKCCKAWENLIFIAEILKA